MHEVEFKIRADHETLRSRLADHGAPAHGTVEQADEYYTPPDVGVHEWDETLRLRRERADGTEAAVLTYKRPAGGAGDGTAAKTRQETETRVGDPEAVATMLTGLGFEAAASKRKTRETYELDGCHVALDDVAGLGEFVEVEVTATADDSDAVAAAAARATAVLDRLGLDPDDHVEGSYLGLLDGRDDATDRTD